MLEAKFGDDLLLTIFNSLKKIYEYSLLLYFHFTPLLLRINHKRNTNSVISISKKEIARIASILFTVNLRIVAMQYAALLTRAFPYAPFL